MTIGCLDRGLSTILRWPGETIPAILYGIGMEAISLKGCSTVSPPRLRQGHEISGTAAIRGERGLAHPREGLLLRDSL